METLRELLRASGETLYMSLVSLVLSYLIGLPLAILLVLTQEGGLFPRKRLHRTLGWIIDMTRSVPFIILMILIVPLTRWIMGSAIGTTAAIVPLTLCAIPFVARVGEQSFKEVDQGTIEAALAMGAKPWQIVVHVYINESLPSLFRGIALTGINIIGYSAMAGALGGGGLGNYAITEGYYRYDTLLVLYTVLIIVVIVILLQTAFNAIAKKINHKK